ncbi:HAD-IA family hydrolase [uncultured Ruegeria sp.]|uniref:HAD-IA family hydrolase n=1 Tax=uncultured Ruegeria sp. TaxID=259304 RepID=UPI00260297C7|nr:HAD-IA family hydrolase [uncultured Ruegeria sp.]
MSPALRLVLFDVDGTLVDSQGAIVSAMTASFQAQSLPVPDRTEILSIVGLSLPHAMARLAPDQSDQAQNVLVEGYKQAYHAQRLEQGAASSPLYPGAREVIETLHAKPEVLLGVATGKSQRGLDALLEAHGLEQYFVTRQVADHHPSKPHPSMIETAMAETGVSAAQTAMVGDTSFDMEMAAAAKVTAIGVSWGYHDRSALSAAHQVIDGFEHLPETLANIWD